MIFFEAFFHVQETELLYLREVGDPIEVEERLKKYHLEPRILTLRR
jgi:hypothetical protein